ncbi:MAG TPA: dihydrofolate reductase [Pseudomonadales bacterium]|nr:dihydrofolate reductase [Pseudomonadales bacterium]
MTQPEIGLIYARSQNWCIGKDGDLPWSLPDDLAHFERITSGYPVIMGRRTYEEGRAPLPGRLNIVVSRQPGYEVAPGIILAASLETALDHAGVHSSRAFVIGGAGLIEAAFPRAKAVFETLVHADVAGDTRLGPLDFTGWQTERLQVHEVDQRHAFAFSIFRHLRPG